MSRPGRDWTDAERLIVLDDYIQSLIRGTRLGSEWTRSTSGLLSRSPGSVNYKLGNLIYARTEVLKLPKAGFEGRADRDKELFEEWHGDPEALHSHVIELRERLFPVATVRTQEPGSERVGLFKWLLTATRAELENQSLLLRALARARDLEGRTVRPVWGTRREGQREFKEGTIVDFVMSAGLDALRACPGCGHTRTKMNGDPILEAHHLVPFSRTLEMDPRWGVPLCCNCHEVSHWGTPEDRKQLFARLSAAFPALTSRLRELQSEGRMSVGEAEDLRSQGLRF